MFFESPLIPETLGERERERERENTRERGCNYPPAESFQNNCEMTFSLPLPATLPFRDCVVFSPSRALVFAHGPRRQEREREREYVSRSRVTRIRFSLLFFFSLARGWRSVVLREENRPLRCARLLLAGRRREKRKNLIKRI